MLRQKLCMHNNACGTYTHIVEIQHVLMQIVCRKCLRVFIAIGDIYVISAVQYSKHVIRFERESTAQICHTSVCILVFVLSKKYTKGCFSVGG